MKEKWKDITKDCKLRFIPARKTGFNLGIIPPEKHDIFYSTRGLEKKRGSGTYKIVGHIDNFSNGVRILQHIKVKDPFVRKWTAEYIKGLNCEKLSDESVLQMCIDQHCEREMELKETGECAESSRATCPMCAKHGFGCAGEDCILWENDRCCGGTRFSDPTAVVAYLQNKLDNFTEEEVEKKEHPFSIGDNVSADDGDHSTSNGWIVAFEKYSKRLLVFDPTRYNTTLGWHSGFGFTYTKGQPVPGMNAHRLFDSKDVTLIEGVKT